MNSEHIHDLLATTWRGPLLMFVVLLLSILLHSRVSGVKSES